MQSKVLHCCSVIRGMCISLIFSEDLTDEQVQLLLDISVAVSNLERLCNCRIKENEDAN